MEAKSKTNSNRNFITELAQAGIESAEAISLFLSRDDRLRDKLPLPGVAESEKWLAFWSDDRLAWDNVLEGVLGQKLSSLVPNEVLMYFDRIRRFLSRDLNE